MKEPFSLKRFKMEYFPVIHERLGTLNQLYTKNWLQLHEKAIQKFETLIDVHAGHDTGVKPASEKISESLPTSPIKPIALKKNKPKLEEQQSRNIKKAQGSDSVFYLISTVAAQEVFMLQILEILHRSKSPLKVLYHVHSNYQPLQQMMDCDTVDISVNNKIEIATLSRKANIHLVHLKKTNAESEQYIKALCESASLPVFILSNQVPTIIFPESQYVLCSHSNTNKMKLKAIEQLCGKSLTMDDASGNYWLTNSSFDSKNVIEALQSCFK